MKTRLLISLIITNLFFADNASCQTWSEVGLGSDKLRANGTIFTMCADTGEVIYAAGGFTNGVLNSDGNYYVAKWDGLKWGELGSGVNSLNATGGINALCLDSKHNLYTAGGFTNANYKYFVAKWDGVSWSELGSGINSLNANNAVYSLCSDSHDNIYAAGFFTDSLLNTSGHMYVAKWNGAGWSQLGTGVNALNADDVIMSMVTDKDDNIYAGGSFRNPANGYYDVAKWNGTSWSFLGLRANYPIWTLHLDKAQNLFVGGFFTNSKGENYVAKFDGTNWTILGADSNPFTGIDPVCSISSDENNNVFAAGATEIFKYDGNKWKIVSSSDSLKANGSIYSIDISKNGTLYAGGAFKEKDSDYCYVAKSTISTDKITNVSIPTDLNIYPNPASGALFVHGSNNIVGKNYQLINSYGTLIATSTISKNEFSVNLSSCIPGTYVLRIDNAIYKVFKR